MEKKYPSIIMATAYLLFTVLFIYAINVAKGVLSPIVLGILFSYLLFPIANLLEKRLRFPRILANILSIILAIVVLSGGFFLIYKQLGQMVTDLPALKAQVIKNAHTLTAFIESKFGISPANQKVWIQENTTNIFENSSAFIGKFFASTTQSIGRIVILPVFIFFMLYYRDKAYEFVIRVASKRNRKRTERILEKISHVTKHYMGGVCIVVMILCVLNPLGLYIVGLKYAVILGIIAAICNFIPYFGTILGFSFPLLFAMFAEDDPRKIVGVVICFFVVQFIENNILTPNIVGGNVRLNPFIIILSLIVGGLIWGIVGMLVIVPLMAIFRIIAENVDTLHPYAFLLGTRGTERHSITFRKIKSIFIKRKIKRRKNERKQNVVKHS